MIPGKVRRSGLGNEWIRAAYHQGGHAAVARMHDIRVRKVGLVYRKPLFLPMRIQGNIALGDVADPDVAMLIYAAGPMAEASFLSREGYAAGDLAARYRVDGTNELDHRRMNHIAIHSSLSPVDAEKLAWDMMADIWRHVALIAGSLLDHGQATGRQIRREVGW